MTTAQQLIEAAYARSTANDAGKLAGDAELIGHLNRKYQSLHAIMAISAGDNALNKTRLVLGGIAPYAVNLPADVIDVVRLEQTDGSIAHLIPADEKDRSWHAAPALYRQGNAIVSRSKTGDLGAGASIDVYHLDAPATLVALVSALDPRFPVRFENLLVLDLAVYLSVKDDGRDEKEYKNLKLELASEQAAFNLLNGLSNTAKE